MKVENLIFGQSCCGEGNYHSEYIAPNGNGFYITKLASTGLFHVTKYAPDLKTVEFVKKHITQQQLDELLNK